MKVILEYDQVTGQVTDATGAILVCWMGLQSFENHQEVSEKSVSVAEIAHLYQQGVSPHDMVTLKENGLL